MSRPTIHNNINEKYGRLTIIKEVKGTRLRKFLCKCECGNMKTIYLGHLLSGNTKSCGCLKKDRNVKVFTKHGLSKSRLYCVWSSMKDRCYRKKSNAYKNYGARGISVCDEWLDFKPFTEWALSNGYQEDLTIERINNDGDYKPGNCTFVHLEKQSKNRRGLHSILFNGVTKTLSDWARSLNICHSSLRERLEKWNIERALTTKNLKKGAKP